MKEEILELKSKQLILMKKCVKIASLKESKSTKISMNRVGKIIGIGWEMIALQRQIKILQIKPVPEFKKGTEVGNVTIPAYHESEVFPSATINGQKAKVTYKGNACYSIVSKP